MNFTRWDFISDVLRRPSCAAPNPSISRRTTEATAVNYMTNHRVAHVGLSRANGACAEAALRNCSYVTGWYFHIFHTFSLGGHHVLLYFHLALEQDLCKAMQRTVTCHRACRCCQILRLGGLRLRLTSLTGNKNKLDCFTFNSVANFRYLPEWDSAHYVDMRAPWWPHARTHFTVKHTAHKSCRRVASEREAGN